MYVRHSASQKSLINISRLGDVVDCNVATNLEKKLDVIMLVIVFAPFKDVRVLLPVT